MGKDSTLKHFILCFLVIASSVLAAIYVPDMATIVVWTGAGTSGFINMTFPCMFYLNVFKEEEMTVRRVFVHIVNIFSVLFTVISVVYLIVPGWFQ